MRTTILALAVGALVSSMGCKWLGRWNCACNSEHQGEYIAPVPAHSATPGGPTLELLPDGQVKKTPHDSRATTVRYTPDTVAPAGVKTQATILGRTPTGELILVVSDPTDRAKAAPETPLKTLPEIPVIPFVPAAPPPVIQE